MSWHRVHAEIHLDTAAHADTVQSMVQTRALADPEVTVRRCERGIDESDNPTVYLDLCMRQRTKRVEWRDWIDANVKGVMPIKNWLKGYWLSLHLFPETPGESLQGVSLDQEDVGL